MATQQRRRKPFGDVEQFRVKGRREKPGRESTVSRQGSFDRQLAYEEAGAKADARRARLREREQRAKTEAAERRRDEAPTPRGPRAQPRGRSLTRPIKLPRVLGKLRRHITRNPRQVLIAEMLAVFTIVTVSRLADGEAPAPSDYLAPFVVYLVLGFGAEFGGPNVTRLAAAFGGLIVVAVIVAHIDGIVRALQAASFGPGEGPADLASQTLGHGREGIHGGELPRGRGGKKRGGTF